MDNKARRIANVGCKKHSIGGLKCLTGRNQLTVSNMQ
jgi:hypothetical protein